MTGRAVYLDASAIVKLVLSETGSQELTEYLLGRAPSVTCRISTTEVSRAVRRQSLDAAASVEAVLATMTVVEVSPDLARTAGRLQPAELRSLDAIHVATALMVAGDIDAVVTYDLRLAAAARLVGLQVESPGIDIGPNPARRGHPSATAAS